MRTAFVAADLLECPVSMACTRPSAALLLRIANVGDRVHAYLFARSYFDLDGGPIWQIGNR